MFLRRRVVALALLAAVVAIPFASLGGGGGDGLSETPRSYEDAREMSLRMRPVELTVSASGDLLVHSPVFQRALALGGGREYDFAPMLEPIRPYVADADLALCHLETPLVDGVPQGYPLFHTPPALARAIARTGWDACSTASNHSLDAGKDGIASTRSALRGAGVRSAGSYARPSQRRRPLLLEVDAEREVEVALLAYTTDTNGIPPPEPWSVALARPARIVGDARAARRAGADAVIVNVHWGPSAVAEYSSEPGDRQRRAARRLASDPAITALVGQGPHVVQPIEFVGSTPVVFSEGNLLSNQTAACCPAETQDGLIALLDVVIDDRGDRARRVRYVPTWVQVGAYEVLPIGSALAEGTADPGLLRASYERTVAVAGRARRIRPVPRELAP